MSDLYSADPFSKWLFAQSNIFQYGVIPTEFWIQIFKNPERIGYINPRWSLVIQDACNFLDSELENADV